MGKHILPTNVRERESIPTSKICSVHLSAHYTHLSSLQGSDSGVYCTVGYERFVLTTQSAGRWGMSSMQRGKDLHRERLMGYQVDTQ